MDNAEFNLLSEPWVVVVTREGVEKEVSLLEVFEHAHEYRALAGELATQDFAILRLLEAILHATFTRADLEGRFDPIDSPDKALTRWKQLWDAGAFPLEAIKARLLPYEDRFYLFHPERPFYQVATLTQGTEYTAAKLIGDLSESGNKPRLFPLRSGTAKEYLSHAEAARWLLYLNGYDDTSAKPSVRGAGLPSVGAGWLGKLGLVAAEGETLFETLLFNFVLLDSNDQRFITSQATWELDEVRQAERVNIPLPTDPLQLLTLHSRRVLLKRENGLVSGYLLLGGDFFERENAFIEQMTVWRKDATAKTDTYVPKRHRESRQVWRDFSALLAETSSERGLRQPGIVSWMATLRLSGLVDKRLFKLKVAGIQFADKDFYVDGIISDSLSMNFNMLTELGNAWVDEIGFLVTVTDKCVWQLGVFAQDIAQSVGNDDERGRANVKAAAQERAYFALDAPFREWLARLDPHSDDHYEMQKAWLDQASRIIEGIAQDIVEEAGERAIVGIYKVGDTSTTIKNAPSAMRFLKYRLAQLCDLSERRTDE
jgi:CRISPR system Cascade subunit CasA